MGKPNLPIFKNKLKILASTSRNGEFFYLNIM